MQSLVLILLVMEASNLDLAWRLMMQHSLA